MKSSRKAAAAHLQPSTSQASQPTLGLATTWELLGYCGSIIRLLSMHVQISEKIKKIDKQK